MCGAERLARYSDGWQPMRLPSTANRRNKRE
jgi:hypothetical protein